MTNYAWFIGGIISTQLERVFPGSRALDSDEGSAQVIGGAGLQALSSDAGVSSNKRASRRQRTPLSKTE